METYKNRRQKMSKCCKCGRNYEFEESPYQVFLDECAKRNGNLENTTLSVAAKESFCDGDKVTLGDTGESRDIIVNEEIAEKSRQNAGEINILCQESKEIEIGQNAGMIISGQNVRDGGEGQNTNEVIPGLNAPVIDLGPDLKVIGTGQNEDEIDIGKNSGAICISLNIESKNVNGIDSSENLRGVCSDRNKEEIVAVTKIRDQNYNKSAADIVFDQIKGDVRTVQNTRKLGAELNKTENLCCQCISSISNSNQSGSVYLFEDMQEHESKQEHNSRISHSDDSVKRIFKRKKQKEHNRLKDKYKKSYKKQKTCISSQKKREDEFEKWAKEFNEHCKEIEAYPLHVEKNGKIITL